MLGYLKGKDGTNKRTTPSGGTPNLLTREDNE
jgi:hypothetical protein